MVHRAQTFQNHISGQIDMHKIVFLVVVASGLCSFAKSEESLDPELPNILNLREQAQVQDAWLARRLDVVLPDLMRREGIDMWIIDAREYNEDPVIKTMMPSTWLAARRRTVIIFYDPGASQTIERLSVSRYTPGPWYQAAWNPEEQEDQWKRVAEIVKERNPRRIAINQSSVFPLADGLTAAEKVALEEAVGPEFSSRLTTGENLALGWLESRIPEEMAVYPTVIRIAHAILAEGLSERVITPGITTTDDVEWWYRERIRNLGLETWFHPGVSIDRAESSEQSMVAQFAENSSSPIILRGDLLHVDFGISYLGLHTDTQHHAYVLRQGETDAPQGLKAGMKAGNRLQDIVIGNFRIGISGNQLLSESREEAIDEGLEPTIYSHAIGFHGHAAGPWIGMWDDQLAQPPIGDYPIHAHTTWSIELNARVPVPEWGGKMVRFKSEEDAYFDGKTVQFLDGRQEHLHLIPRQ